MFTSFLNELEDTVRIQCFEIQRCFQNRAQMFLHLLEDTAGVAKAPPRVGTLLSSRACRSAVMFGDQLPPERCTALLRQLAVHPDPLAIHTNYPKFSVCIPTYELEQEELRAVLHPTHMLSN